MNPLETSEERKSTFYHVIKLEKEQQMDMSNIWYLLTLLTFLTYTNYSAYNLVNISAKLLKIIKLIIKYGWKHCGKGEIARHEQFLFMPQCFQKLYGEDAT